MKYFLLLLLVICCSNCINNREETKSSNFEMQENPRYSVGDTLQTGIKQVTFLQTQEIQAPFISFREPDFTLKLSKNELIKSIDTFALNLDSIAFPDLLMVSRITLAYLNAEPEITFENIWSKSDEFSNTGWQDAATIGHKWAISKFLLEYVCELIELGRFQIEVNSKEESEFYFYHTPTYRGLSNGVFIEERKLIWICPPHAVY